MDGGWLARMCLEILRFGGSDFHPWQVEVKLMEFYTGPLLQKSDVRNEKTRQPQKVQEFHRCLRECSMPGSLSDMM